MELQHQGIDALKAGVSQLTASYVACACNRAGNQSEPVIIQTTVFKGYGRDVALHLG